MSEEATSDYEPGGVLPVLVMIHGMVTERYPSDHELGYRELTDNLAARGVRFRRAVGVEWGHEPAKSPPLTFDQLREDERLTRAEARLYDRVSERGVRANPSPNNRTLGATDDLLSTATRQVTQRIKDEVMLYGITDALYYASPDGETAVRSTVYHQVLSALEGCKDAGEVRLFVVAHSLGVTVAHDFLYGLFAPHHYPDYAAPESEPDANKPTELRAGAFYADDKDRYLYWRDAARRATADAETAPAESAAPGPRLTLGAFATAGGQLPLMMVRKQKLVDQLAQAEPLDPSVIGVPREGKPRWVNFYDADDVLGFPCRLLYGEAPTIVEYHVNTGIFQNAHTGYWRNDRVIKEMADLIRANLPG